MRGIRLRAVAAGFLVTGAISLALRTVAATVILVAHGTPAGLLWWLLALPTVALSVAAGGFVAARMSKPNAFGAAITVGVLDLLLMSWFVFEPQGLAWAWWMSVIFLALIVPAALGGGYLARPRTA